MPFKLSALKTMAAAAAQKGVRLSSANCNVSTGCSAGADRQHTCDPKQHCQNSKLLPCRYDSHKKQKLNSKEAQDPGLLHSNRGAPSLCEFACCACLSGPDVPSSLQLHRMPVETPWHSVDVISQQTCSECPAGQLGLHLAQPPSCKKETWNRQRGAAASPSWNLKVMVKT